MDRSTPINLIKETYVEDQYGVLHSTESKRLVFANVTSVNLSEWSEGGRNGLNPELRVRMFAPDYQGEKIVEVNHRQYAVYRTYQARTDVIELYLERRQGAKEVSQ